MSYAALRRRRLVQAAVEEVPPTPSISIALSSAAGTVIQGSTTTLSVTLTRGGGFAGTVTPSVTGLPTGVTGSWSDSALADADAATVLTLTAAVDAPPVSEASFSITLSGSGVTDATASAAVTVAAPFVPGDLAGANVPSWPGMVVNAEEDFTTPIPVYPTAANANGFRGFQGFDVPSGYYAVTHIPTRVAYPVVSTPLGTKPVLEFTFPGQTTLISAADAVTPPWHFWDDEYTDVGLNIEGTWEGTLVFEQSTDGGDTWSAVVMTGRLLSFPSTFSPNLSSTNINGKWRLTTPSAEDKRLFRVRATAWTSGTATLEIGMAGGYAPARGNFGAMTPGATKFYLRALLKSSANYRDNDNAGTKLFFFSQKTENGQTNNHYVGYTNENLDAISALVGLQGHSFTEYRNDVDTAPHGYWLDLEVQIEANTPGVANGIAKMWFNGVLVLDRSDCLFFASLQTPTFTGIWSDMTYGGGINPPPEMMTCQFASWYVASAV
jgi:hypothetical protein